MSRRSKNTAVGAVVVAAALLLNTFLPDNDKGTTSGDPTSCPNLPAEAWDTIDLIESGGPYRHPEDDSRFGNYEGTLPDEPLGYYREYTVDTPGVHHRGLRRIVTGGGADGVVDEWYYTDNHYDTFCEIQPR